MIKLSAFIDESGDPHFNDRASESLVYSCVLVEKDKVGKVEEQALKVKSDLGLIEFKSSGVRTDKRRYEILSKLVQLEIKFLWLIIDKSKVFGDWRLFPRSFYKYTQKLLHRELYSLFPGIGAFLS